MTDPAKRHARRYLSNDKGDPGAMKPGGARVTPVRAWLEPRDNGLPEEYRLPDQTEPWSLTVENGAENPAFGGDFSDLVKIARSHACLEFFVWSPTRRTFEQVAADDVHPVD